MRETTVEDYLKKEIKKIGGMSIKFVSPGLRGVPDQLVMLPCGLTCFVEVKAPGKKPTKQQLKRHKMLRDLEQLVYTVDNYMEVDNLVTRLKFIGAMEKYLGGE